MASGGSAKGATSPISIAGSSGPSARTSAKASSPKLGAPPSCETLYTQTGVSVKSVAPVSSRSSRAAACSGVSPVSRWPPGISHVLRCLWRTKSQRPCMRVRMTAKRMSPSAPPPRGWKETVVLLMTGLLQDDALL